MKEKAPKSSTANQKSHYSANNNEHEPFFNPSSKFFSRGIAQKKAAPFFEKTPSNPFFKPFKKPSRISTIQKQGIEAEEDLQMKEASIQKKASPEQPVPSGLPKAQSKGVERSQRENNTGLPDHLKSGVENLSGYAMDDVKVHYNSDKPAQLQAHAYAQGTDIHLAPGQEKHLPHEAWHVVQQKQGRVQPTIQMRDNVNVNDDAGLEKEAYTLGNKAAGNIGLVKKESHDNLRNTPKSGNKQQYPIQMITFARTITGAIGGIINRPDYTADNWIASFNQLNTLVNVTMAPYAANLDLFPEYNLGYTIPNAFILANTVAHISRSDRDRVGTEIMTNLQNAQTLQAQYVTLGPNAGLLGGLNPAQKNVFKNLVPVTGALAGFAALPAAQFTAFFNLPIAELNDFLTIPNAQKVAILANINLMTQVGGLDQAYTKFNGNPNQGHTFSEHGAHHSDARMQELADNSGNAKGRWIDFGVQQAAITQAENTMWDPATYAANPLNSALRAPGNSYIRNFMPTGPVIPANLAALRAAPSHATRTKKRVSLTGQNYVPGNTGMMFTPKPPLVPAPAPVPVGHFTAVFDLTNANSYEVVTAYPVPP